MRICNSHGFASEADTRVSDSDSQAFLIMYESPYRRRFLSTYGHSSTVPLWCGFAIRMESQAKRIRANPTPIRTCPLANPSIQVFAPLQGVVDTWREEGPERKEMAGISVPRGGAPGALLLPSGCDNWALYGPSRWCIPAPTLFHPQASNTSTMGKSLWCRKLRVPDR